MADGLKIQVGADVKPAIDAFRDLEAQAKRSATAAGQSFGTGVTKGATALKSFTTSSNTATQSLVNLGRVVQDAPFGFIGIANNLNPLLESFQRLKATTGTTGGALKALGKELSGAGGIGFALSVASSLLITFGDKLFGASQKSKELAEQTQKAADAQKEIVSSLGKESSLVAQIVSLIKSETATRQQKESALARLKQINPQYFGDLNTEIGLIDKLDKAYKKYLKSLVARSEVAVLTKELDELSAQIIDLERQGAKTTFIAPELKRDLQGNLVINQKITKEQAAQNALNFKYLQALDKRDLVLNRISQTTAALSDNLQLDPITPPKITFTKPVSLDFRQFDFGEIQIPPEDVKPIATEFGVMFSKELNDYFKNNGLFDPSIAAAQTLEKQQKAILGIFGVQANADSPFTQIQREAIFAAQTIQQVLTPAFQGLFDAIVAGENPLKAFFSGLGQAVAQLIQKLISAAITAAILSAIFPGGLGGVQGFGGFFKGLVGFASGGIVSGPTLALVGEGAGTSRSNPEVIAPLDQLRSMIADMGGGGSQRVVVTGRLRGNDMVLQNARTSRYQQRTTGR